MGRGLIATWLWLQPIVIDLHFKITLYEFKHCSSLSRLKYVVLNQYFPLRGEPKAHGQWCSNRILLNDINGNHSRALPWAVPVQHRGKILLYHFVSSNEDVPGLKFTGWDEVVMLGISKNDTFLFSNNPAVQPISLVKVRVRCGVGLGVSIFVA